MKTPAHLFMRLLQQQLPHEYINEASISVRWWLRTYVLYGTYCQLTDFTVLSWSLIECQKVIAKACEPFFWITNSYQFHLLLVKKNTYLLSNFQNKENITKIYTLNIIWCTERYWWIFPLKTKRHGLVKMFLHTNDICQILCFKLFMNLCFNYLC